MYRARMAMAAACTASLCLAGQPAVGAQATTPAQPAGASTPAQATPRLADGRPDLNGVWGSGNQGASNAVQKGNTLVVLFQLEDADPFEGKDLFKALDRRGVARKANEANKPPYKPELAATLKQYSDEQSKRDPAFYCLPEGVPRMGAPSQIVQTPGQVVLLYEGRNTFRVIPTDGRPHREDVDPSWNGDAVGSWDGDTLVIDVRNFTDESWLGADGWFHSDKMRVLERLRREGNKLRWEAVVEDPQVLTEPWRVTPRTLTLLTDRADALMESPPCKEQDGPHLMTNEHH